MPQCIIHPGRRLVGPLLPADQRFRRVGITDGVLGRADDAELARSVGGTRHEPDHRGGRPRSQAHRREAVARERR